MGSACDEPGELLRVDPLRFRHGLIGTVAIQQPASGMKVPVGLVEAPQTPGEVAGGNMRHHKIRIEIDRASERRRSFADLALLLKNRRFQVIQARVKFLDPNGALAPGQRIGLLSLIGIGTGEKGCRYCRPLTLRAEWKKLGDHVSITLLAISNLGTRDSRPCHSCRPRKHGFGAPRSIPRAALFWAGTTANRGSAARSIGRSIMSRHAMSGAVAPGAAIFRNAITPATFGRRQVLMPDLRTVRRTHQQPASFRKTAAEIPHDLLRLVLSHVDQHVAAENEIHRCHPVGGRWINVVYQIQGRKSDMPPDLVDHTMTSGMRANETIFSITAAGVSRKDHSP